MVNTTCEIKSQHFTFVTDPRCMIVEYLPGGDLLSFMLKSRQYRARNEDGTPVEECETTIDEVEEGEANSCSVYTAEGSFLSASDLMTFALQIAKGMQHVASLNVRIFYLFCFINLKSFTI